MIMDWKTHFKTPFVLRFIYIFNPILIKFPTSLYFLFACFFAWVQIEKMILKLYMEVLKA